MIEHRVSEEAACAIVRYKEVARMLGLKDRGLEVSMNMPEPSVDISHGECIKKFGPLLGDADIQQDLQKKVSSVTELLKIRGVNLYLVHSL